MSKKLAKLTITAGAKVGLALAGGGLRMAGGYLPDVIVPLASIFASALEDIADAGATESDGGSIVTRQEVHIIVTGLIDSLQGFAADLVE